MKAGRDLDALVAEKVMGERVDWSYGEPYTNLLDQRRARTYSTDIAEAWAVVEKMRDGGFDFDASSFGRGSDSSRWQMRFLKKLDDCFYAQADTAPHAICLAALRAVGVEVPP